MKIRPMETEFFHEEEQKDGQTDTEKFIVDFAILRTRLKAE
jgi:hypothetical protein